MAELSKPQAPEGAPPEAPSKSQVKRERHALQGLAQRLVALPRPELERLALSEATWAAIDETSRIKDLRALRRHYKRIAKLLVGEDVRAVASLMDERDGLKQAAAARHHRLERWRDRLIAEGDAALGELLAECPGADRQRLRALIRAAQRGKQQGRADAARRLYRWLRDELDGEGADLS
jgi:ribosome-associated protein